MLSVLHRKVYRSHSVCFKAIPQGIFYLQPNGKTINKIGSNFFSSYYLLLLICFTWLQTTEQRAIMSSAGLQIHLQTHGSQSNASKHDQLTNKIALFSRHAALSIYLVLQDDERNLRVFTAVFLFLVSSCHTIFSRQIQF